MTSFCQFRVYRVPKGVFRTKIQISLRLAWQWKFRGKKWHLQDQRKLKFTHSVGVWLWWFHADSQKSCGYGSKDKWFHDLPPFSSPQHDPWTHRPGQPAPRTGLPEERRSSLHSFRQMDKSAEHTQPSDCEQAHMMVHKTKRQIGMFEYIYVHFEWIWWGNTLHRFWECHQMSSVLLYWWQEKCKIYLVFVLGFFFPCATYKCFNKSPNVYEKVDTISWIRFPAGNKHLSIQSIGPPFIALMGETLRFKCAVSRGNAVFLQATKALFGPRRMPFQVTPISQLRWQQPESAEHSASWRSGV